ncbi:MAG: hypothetical protein R3F17_14915 [Planctomycetota bacterium]
MRETLNLTEEDGLQALRMHLQERARVAHLRYPDLGQESSLRALLRDGEIVRFPVELRFGTEGLIPGEFAHAEPKEDRAAAGFTLFVHPQFEAAGPIWPRSCSTTCPASTTWTWPVRKKPSCSGPRPWASTSKTTTNAFVPWRMNWDPLRWIPCRICSGSRWIGRLRHSPVQLPGSGQRGAPASFASHGRSSG